jgi:hypothetical protein
VTKELASDDSTSMGAVADEIPRTLAGGQEVGEDRRDTHSPELSREGWKDLFVRLATGDSRALETLYLSAARSVFGLALWRTGFVEEQEGDRILPGRPNGKESAS